MFGVFVYGQTSLKLNNISHVVLRQDNVSVIQYKGGLYQYKDVDLKGFDEITNPMTFDKMQKNMSSLSIVIPVEELAVFKNPGGFSDFIMNSQFEFKNDGNTILFSPVSPYFYAIETVRANNEKTLNSVLYRTVVLNDKYFLVLMDSGFILFDSHHKVKFFNHYDLVQNVSAKPYDKNYSRQILSRILTGNPIDYNYKKETEKSEKTVIYNYSFNETLPFNNYDTVYIERPFFIAEKGNKTAVYDYKGKLLFKKKFRNWQVSQRTAQLIALEKNEIVYYDFDGLQSEEKQPEPLAVCGLIDGKSYRIDSADSHIIIFEYHSWGEDDFQQKIHLRNLPEKSIVRFVNDELWPPSSFNIEYPLDLLVSYEGKSGLFRCKESLSVFEMEESPEVEVEEILPLVYDKIELFHGKLLLYKDGLIAVYPYAKTPNYISIGEFKSGYYRITSQNQKKGWLAWYSGKEFWDE